MEPKLLSVVIDTYRNGDLVYEAIQSVLDQDYPAIELIVTNDASDDFDAAAIEAWTRAHAGANIKSVLVKNHAQNGGSIKNLEWGRTHCRGEFFACLDGDDAYDSPASLSAGVAELERLGPEAYIVLATGCHCGDTLTEVIGPTISPQAIEAIKTCSPQELQLKNIPRLLFVFYPVFLCCRMSLFDKVGGFDTRYRLLEDWPLTQKICRAGIRIHWLDGASSIRHRGGGISYGNTRAGSAAGHQLAVDYYRFYQWEMRPYKKYFTKDEKQYMHRFALDMLTNAGPAAFPSPFERAYVALRLGANRVWQAVRKQGGYILHRYILRDKYR